MIPKVSIQWTETALQTLRALPKKVQRGLITKADELLQCDPRTACKPLTGPLAGFYRMVYSRYRAVFSVHAEKMSDSQTVLHITVRFVLVGVRKSGDKRDIYRIAERMVDSLLKGPARKPPED